MKQKMMILYAVLALLLVGAGIVVYKFVSKPKAPPVVVKDQSAEDVPQVDSSVTVDVTKSKIKDNALKLSISGLAGKYTSVAYEISYDTQGVSQGVVSKPSDISGKDSAVIDEIYLGTCSRNVCRPHVGVKTVSLVLEFTDSKGQKSQFSKDYDL